MQRIVFTRVNIQRSKKVQTLQKILLINAPRVCVIPSNDEREVRMDGWMDRSGKTQSVIYRLCDPKKRLGFEGKCESLRVYFCSPVLSASVLMSEGCQIIEIMDVLQVTVFSQALSINTSLQFLHWPLEAGCRRESVP